MPGPISDAYDPEYGTASNEDKAERPTDTPTEHALDVASDYQWGRRIQKHNVTAQLWARLVNLARLIDRERAEAVRESWTGKSPVDGYAVGYNKGRQDGAARERERIAAWLEIEVAGSPLAKKLAAQIRAQGEGER